MTPKPLFSQELNDVVGFEPKPVRTSPTSLDAREGAVGEGYSQREPVSWRRRSRRTIQMNFRVEPELHARFHRMSEDLRLIYPELLARAMDALYRELKDESGRKR